MINKDLCYAENYRDDKNFVAGIKKDLAIYYCDEDLDVGQESE